MDFCIDNIAADDYIATDDYIDYCHLQSIANNAIDTWWQAKKLTEQKTENLIWW